MSYELENSLGFKINQTANKINNHFTKILQTFEIAPEQRATLEIIKYEKDVNQTKIANMLAKDKTTISRTLSTLENKGFITKLQIDKRTNQIKLTDLGEKILKDSEDEVKIFRNILNSNLNPNEIDTIIKLLDKITKNLNEK